MKCPFLKTILFLGILTASCTEKDNSADQPSFPDKIDAEKLYLSVNLVTPGSILTRDDTDSQDWEYNEGTDSESNVQSVRLYFFDELGNPVNVNKTPTDDYNYLPYFDCSPSSAGNDMTQNVEKIYTTTLCLEPEGGRIPTQLLAVVNPNSVVTSKANPTLSELKTLVSDFLTGLDNDNFVMTNSVYMEGAGENKSEVYTTSIGNNIYYDEESAKKNPALSVYVERVVARLDLSFSTNSDDIQNIIGQEDTYDTGITLLPVDSDSGTKIYVKLLGWAVTSTPSVSRLVKSIDKEWSTQQLFSNAVWNSPAFHRSFWAINPPEPEFKWFSFNDISGKGTSGKRADGCFGMDTQTVYMQENANPYGSPSGKAANPDFPSKVICAGQLINEAGKPISIAEYEGKRYTLEGLLNSVASSLDMYFEDGTDGEGKKRYTKIKPSHLEFETFMQREGDNNPDPDREGTYLVYFKLSDEAKLITWYHKFDPENEEEPQVVENPSKALADATFEAKVWLDGYTYYYFDIPHQGKNLDDPGYFGVVRNHIYNAEVVKIMSLGTPVYSPDEIIYPEKPASSGNMFKANIRILQWRRVKKNLQLAW